MKHALNMLTEIMALPYSGYFFSHDPVRESIKHSCLLDNDRFEGKRADDFDKALSVECQSAATYINRYAEITNLTELQMDFRYVYQARSLLKCLERNPCLCDVQSLVNHFYILKLEKLSNTFLTNRSGKATLRYWDGPQGSYFDQLEPPLQARVTGRAKAAQNHAFLPQRIEGWHSLLQCLPEDLILCNYAAILSRSGSISQKRCNSVKILLDFGENVCLADQLLDKVLEKGMAENHIHAGASRSFGLVWESMLQSCGKAMEKSYRLSFKGKISRDEMNDYAEEAAVIRLILAAYLQSRAENLRQYISSFITEGYRLPFYVYTEEIYQQNQPSEAFHEKIHWSVPFQTAAAAKSNDLWKILHLPPSLRLSCPTLAERCFLTWSILHIRDNPSDRHFTSLFLYYIRIKNSVYRNRVQDRKSTGLLYFQQFYNLSTDYGKHKPEEKLTQILYTALQDPRVQKTELRSKPPYSFYQNSLWAEKEIELGIYQYIRLFIQRHVYTLLLLYNDGKFIHTEAFEHDFLRRWNWSCEEIKNGHSASLKALMMHFGANFQQIPDHKFGIIYHMIKLGEAGEDSSCFAAPDGNSQKALMGKFSFGKARFQYSAAVSAISNVRDKSPALASLIVGIDAASLEIPTEPWVFAPSFQEARKRNALLARDGELSTQKPLLGITYHVGEDYRHPISGLRHMDEAIQYLRLHSGDRIGHGLAISVNLNEWFQKHRLISIPRIEMLENYLWIWSLLTKESISTSLSKYTSFIESQIMELANEIYGGLNGITIDNLYQAYSVKARPTEDVQALATNYTGSKINDCASYIDNAKFFPCRQSTIKLPFWTAEDLSLSYHCSFYKRRMNAPVLLTPSEEQNELANELQQYLRKKVADIGIVVETNPSSNATVGEINGVLQHPASVLRDGASPKVLASINTDDPSVFNATIANEHAHIYYSFRSHGHSAEEALKLVDEMRETGLETSFVGSVQPIEKLLLEYEQALRVILR